MSAPAWVIVITKPSAEELAERSLRQAGFRVYLPRYRREMRPHGSERRGKPSMRPLFTGYVFVQDWHGWPNDPVTGTVGLMRSAGKSVDLSDVDIARIWEREKDGKFDEMPTPRSKQARRDDLSIGDSVEFQLYGERIMAVLDELSENGKAVVRGLMFNREITFRDVDAGDLLLVGARQNGTNMRHTPINAVHPGQRPSGFWRRKLSDIAS